MNDHPSEMTGHQFTDPADILAARPQSFKIESTDAIDRHMAQAWIKIKKDPGLSDTYKTKAALIRHLIGVGLSEFLQTQRG